jgi:hypothetical protein
MLNPAVAAARASYAEAFRSASPFRHVVIDEFLEPALAQRLLAEFPRFEDRYALNEMGEVGGKAVRTEVRALSEPYRALDAYIRTPEFLRFVSEVTGIPDLLYDPDYVGGGTHENVHGQSLDPHVDFNYHPGTKWHRRLNLIVYLNPEWDAAWGGNLELHRDPWSAAANETRRVLPLMNRCVIFETTETSWHGFTRIELPPDRRGLSRKSFAIYLYTRERPAPETAPPHATIYVPDAMPEHLAAGHTLTAADVAELERRFAQLRGQLKFLYQRETDFTRQIANLEHALAEARSAQRVDLQGYATQDAGPVGFWPDGWAARDARFAFTPTQRAKGLVLDVWVPDRLDGPQQLTIRADGAVVEQTLRPGTRRSFRVPLTGHANQRVEVAIAASRDWTPKATGGDDERPLAWRLVHAGLEH